MYYDKINGLDKKISKLINTSKMLLGVPNHEKDDATKVANYRGIGLSDMVDSIRKTKKSKCSIDLALHILEVMKGILISSEKSSIYKMLTSCLQPEHLTEKEIEKLKVN